MPLLKPLVYRTVGCNMPAAKDHSLDKIRCIFQEVDNVLADGRPFLCGNKFTAADLTFASLAGPVLCPVGYGTYLVPTEELPSEMSEVTLSLRETLAGKHALRMYETERHRKVASKVLVT
jgi:glutathione S-transferase